MKLSLSPILVAGAIPLASALHQYAIPAAFSKILMADDCVLPEDYTISNYVSWTPAAGNNRSVVIEFDYEDPSTSLQTKCQFNASSVNVGRPGLAARYACNDPTVEFITVSNTTIDMIEKACPNSGGASSFEASGTADLTLTCTATSCSSTYGDGTSCEAAAVSANFTSLEPPPPGA